MWTSLGAHFCAYHSVDNEYGIIGHFLYSTVLLGDNLNQSFNVNEEASNMYFTLLSSKVE